MQEIQLIRFWSQPKCHLHIHMKVIVRKNVHLLTLGFPADVIQYDTVPYPFPFELITVNRGINSTIGSPMEPLITTRNCCTTAYQQNNCKQANDNYILCFHKKSLLNKSIQLYFGLNA